MPICPRCGRHISEEESMKCPFCGASLGNRSSELGMTAIYITLFLGGVFAALFFGIYYIAYLLYLGGIILFATLFYQKQMIVKMVGFFIGSLLGTSCLWAYFLQILGRQYEIEMFTFILLILACISLIYNPLKKVRWTDEMYRGGASMMMRVITLILVLRPVVFVLGIVCIIQGILLISYGHGLLDVFTSLASS